MWVQAESVQGHAPAEPDQACCAAQHRLTCTGPWRRAVLQGTAGAKLRGAPWKSGRYAMVSR